MKRVLFAETRIMNYVLNAKQINIQKQEQIVQLLGVFAIINSICIVFQGGSKIDKRVPWVCALLCVQCNTFCSLLQCIHFLHIKNR